MGNVIEKINIKSLVSSKPDELEVYFDSGSPFTFIYDIKLDLKNKKIILNKKSLLRAQIVR